MLVRVGRQTGSGRRTSPVPTTDLTVSNAFDGIFVAVVGRLLFCAPNKRLAIRAFDENLN